MSENHIYEDQPTGEILQQISSQLRLSLLNIHNALERLAPPDVRDGEESVDLNAAVLCQSYYRILRIANNLADASEPERRTGRGICNEDIVELCRSVADRASGPAELLGITLEFHSEKDSHIIAIDKERIERLLWNLLSNAFKFIGTGEKRVTMTVRIEGQFVKLLVSDTGCGIAPEKMETIFERFRQPNRMEPPPSGLGLGLPICKRIAEEHGGSLTPLSEPGKGTTMTVSLPNRKMMPRVREPSLLIPPAEGFNRTLVELSDALPKQAFTQKYLD